MTLERDAVLLSYFRDAEQEFDDPGFTDAVAARMKQRRRNLLLGKIAIVVSIVLLEVLLESPVQHSLGRFTEVLGRDLIPIGGGWIGFFLSPLNSIAGLVGMTLIGLNLLYRRIVY